MGCGLAVIEIPAAGGTCRHVAGKVDDIFIASKSKLDHLDLAFSSMQGEGASRDTDAAQDDAGSDIWSAAGDQNSSATGEPL